MPPPLRRREKTFTLGPRQCVPLDRNAKVRIVAYARAWSAQHCQPGQHRGPITRAFMEVLEALLWGFHNARDGRCFPSYEAIAAKAQCARSTVYEAIKVLELAGALTWEHRLTRIRERTADLFGQWVTRWRVIRTSNAYRFLDPKPGAVGPISSKSENPIGTQNQDSLPSLKGPAIDPNSPLERALQSLRGAIDVRLLGKEYGSTAPAT